MIEWSFQGKNTADKALPNPKIQAFVIINYREQRNLGNIASHNKMPLLLAIIKWHSM